MRFIFLSGTCQASLNGTSFTQRPPWFEHDGAQELVPSQAHLNKTLLLREVRALVDCSLNPYSSLASPSHSRGGLLASTHPPSLSVNGVPPELTECHQDCLGLSSLYRRGETGRAAKVQDNVREPTRRGGRLAMDLFRDEPRGSWAKFRDPG